jgi:hypothetical protein
MNPTYLKLTEEVANDIKARVKSLDIGAIEKLRKAKDENGTFDVIISTEDLDRAGEIVRQDGWELNNYKNNPIVLWGHDYYSLPIGVCTETYKTNVHGVPATGAKGVFYPADINPLAQQVRRMYEFGVKSGVGVGCTTSVGFIPKEFDEDNQRIITRAELLEFSFVPIPANQGVGPAQGRAFTFDEARTLGLNVDVLTVKGMTFAETLGYIPKDISDTKAPENTAWSKPSLTDFTDKGWEDLSDAEKREIAGHYAWAAENPAKSFGDLKLPHHEAKSGAVVWNGVKAAMGALMGARGGVDVDGDKKAVYDHLARHYRQFEKDPPEFKTLKEAQPGDGCTMDDGTPGVLTSDPKDPDGALVCLPVDEDKSAKGGDQAQKKLVKALHDEHARHGDEVEKALDDFREKAAVPEDQGDLEEAGKKAKDGKAEAMREHLKDLRSALADEHTMHRAKSIACFRSFEPSNEKAFDRKEHLKALRGEHDGYEGKNTKALDEFEEKCMKSVQGAPGEHDEHTDWITTKMVDSQRVHKKAVTKIAKAMCKDAFGEEDQADEKTLDILNEYIAPHLDPQIRSAVIAKAGARLSAATKEKLGEAHEHLKAAKAVLEALHGGLADDREEESGSDGGKAIDDASREIGSRPRSTSRSDDALKAHIQAREIVGGIEAVARDALGRLNAEVRAHSRK